VEEEEGRFYMADSISEIELRRMVIAAALGRTIEPSTPYAARVWVRIRSEVADILSRPEARIDLPSDLP
jgi:hypothetical protein